MLTPLGLFFNDRMYFDIPRWTEKELRLRSQKGPNAAESQGEAHSTIVQLSCETRRDYPIDCLGKESVT